MADLGLNGMLPCSGAVQLPDLITYGMWAVVTNESHPVGSIASAMDSAVVGVSAGEEPSAVAQYETIRAAADKWLGNASDGAGRFHQFNFADNLLNGETEFTYYPKDMVIGWVSNDGSYP